MILYIRIIKCTVDKRILKLTPFLLLHGKHGIVNLVDILLTPMLRLRRHHRINILGSLLLLLGLRRLERLACLNGRLFI